MHGRLGCPGLLIGINMNYLELAHMYAEERGGYGLTQDDLRRAQEHLKKSRIPEPKVEKIKGRRTK